MMHISVSYLDMAVLFMFVYFSLFSCASSSIRPLREEVYRSRQLQITFTSDLTRTACMHELIVIPLMYRPYTMIIDTINI